jgi:hypothetical protein
MLAAMVMAGLLGAAGPASAIGLRIGQPAPEITGGPWINSAPLSLAEQRGRVVLVEFWTFG